MQLTIFYVLLGEDGGGWVIQRNSRSEEVGSSLSWLFEKHRDNAKNRHFNLSFWKSWLVYTD